MKTPQFAERQYEIAASIELANGGAGPFVPTPHLEKHLGIDAAFDPQAAHAIWRILSVQIPRRIPLSPVLWPRLPRRFWNEIPARYASLFLQFKRARLQDHRRAKHFRRIGNAYYEVPISRYQQRNLSKLEVRVRSTAVVRYAAPAFWSRSDFDLHEVNRCVLQSSSYEAPARIRNHRRWMYTGPGGKAFFNPDLEETEGEGWESVVRAIGGVAKRQTLDQHVRGLSELLREGEPSLAEDPGGRWTERLQGYGRFAPEDIKLLVDLSIVAAKAAEAESSWLILMEPDDQYGWLRTSDRSIPGWPWWPYWPF